MLHIPEFIGTTKLSQVGRVARITGAALLLGFAAAGAAQAQECEGSEIYLEDTFDDNLSSWPDDGEHTAVRDGRYFVAPNPGNNGWSTKLGGWGFENVEICVDVRLEQNGGEYMGAGLMFWLEDFENNFDVLLFTDNDIWVRRENNNKYSTVKLIDNSPAVNGALGVDNRVMVRLDSGVLTVFVNGQEVLKARVQSPRKETEMGFFVYGREGANQASFDNLIITSID